MQCTYSTGKTQYGTIAFISILCSSLREELLYQFSSWAAQENHWVTGVFGFSFLKRTLVRSSQTRLSYPEKCLYEFQLCYRKDDTRRRVSGFLCMIGGGDCHVLSSKLRQKGEYCIKLHWKNNMGVLVIILLSVIW